MLTMRNTVLIIFVVCQACVTARYEVNQKALPLPEPTLENTLVLVFNDDTVRPEEGYKGSNSVVQCLALGGWPALFWPVPTFNVPVQTPIMPASSKEKIEFKYDRLFTQEFNREAPLLVDGSESLETLMELAKSKHRQYVYVVAYRMADAQAYNRLKNGYLTDFQENPSYAYFPALSRLLIDTSTGGAILKKERFREVYVWFGLSNGWSQGDIFRESQTALLNYLERVGGKSMEESRSRSIEYLLASDFKRESTSY